MKPPKKPKTLIFLLMIIIAVSFSTKTSSNDFLNYTDNIQADITSNPVESDFNSGSNLLNSIEEINETPMIIVTGENYFNGTNLFILRKIDQHTVTSNFSVFLTDMNGKTLFYLDMGTTAIRVAKFINATTIMIGLTEGVLFWNIYSDITYQVSLPERHHDIEYNPINNSVITFSQYTWWNGDEDYMFDMINEYDMNGQLIWSLDTRSFISHEQWCPYHDFYGTVADVTHSNTIFFDVEEDVLFVNSRNTNTFYKIDHQTGNEIWALGEYGNFTLFDINGIERDFLFFHGHSVEKIDNDTFIIFDNDLHNQTSSSNRISRIVEIKINETTMTANESWVWAAPPTYYSDIWGDADHLPNNNRLGTFGTTIHPSSNIGASLVEVNEAGEFVWQMLFPSTTEFRYGIYRMDRVLLAPRIQASEQREYLSGSNSSFTWEIWYNFRSNIQMNGTYELYVDNTLISADQFTFNSFWRSRDFSMPLNTLNDGNHNLTLSIFDEAGHKTINKVIITINPYFIERKGPTVVKQASSETIQWSGVSNLPLTANITLNGSLLNSETWNGQVLTLDLNPLETGSHLISLYLINNSEVLYNDTFWLYVLDSVDPEISAFSPNSTIFWNETKILSWEARDDFPASWSIFVENEVIKEGDWTTNYLFLNWTIPILNEGTYNITLAVYDLIGNFSSVTTWLQVIPPDTPIIAKVPEISKVFWHQQPLNLSWEVHGGLEWTLYRNESELFDGDITGNQLTIEIDDFRELNFLPGNHELTLEIVNELGNSDVKTIIISIEVIFGDPYANFVIQQASQWYSSGENALGKPDGIITTLHLDYGNGYLTLDMGEGEEIINGEGNDFQVIAPLGGYSIGISNDVSVPFSTIGFGYGNSSYDLDTTSFESVRYIRIEYRSGIFVQVDGIIAFNYNAPVSDEDPPVFISHPIQGRNTINVSWEEFGNKIFPFEWEVYDSFPLNYSISVNGSIRIAAIWRESKIKYDLEVLSQGTYIIELKCWDLFNNHLVDVITLNVVSPLSTATTTITTTQQKQATFSLLGVFIGLIPIILRKNRKK